MFNDKQLYEAPVSETVIAQWEGDIATSVHGGPVFYGMNEEEEW